jgi:PAT family beta-lactamase induction signal transducer AmpG
LPGLQGTIVGPVSSFFKKNGFNIALAILAFIFLFKIGEAFLGRMSVIFYKEIGFTKSDIALYSKGLGMDYYYNFYSFGWAVCN